MSRLLSVLFLLGLAALGYIVFSLNNENTKLGYAAESIGVKDQEIAALKSQQGKLRQQIKNLEQATSQAADQAFIDLQPMVISLSDERDALEREVATLNERLALQGSEPAVATPAANPAVVTALTQERDNLLAQVSSLQSQLSTTLNGAESEIKKQMSAILGERDKLANSLAALTGERDNLRTQIGQLQSQIQNFISQAQGGNASDNLNQLLQGFKIQ